ncbi:MAG: hypothetical protein RLZZ203_2478 [Cyanobacteriota bacterium]|jgi:hypothetical protein
MALTEEQEATFYQKVSTERDILALQLVNNKIAVDIATISLSNIQKFTPLAPSIVYSVLATPGVIPAGAYHVSFQILATGGTICGTALGTDLEVVEFPYVGVPWGEISYAGDFLILIGR